MSYGTRSKTGHTPKKPDLPGMVETPFRSRRSRKSMAADIDENSATDTVASVVTTSSAANGASADVDDDDDAKPSKKGSTRNGSVKRSSRTSGGAAATTATRGRPKTTKALAKEDSKIDDSGVFEFGGSVGSLLIMVGFPILMYYMWIGATYYDGKLPTPAQGQGALDFLKHLASLAYLGAFPSLKAWAIYWGFFIFEALLYVYMPGGVYMEGKPLLHEGGRKLRYYCSGMPSFYFTIALAAALHVAGLFPLYTLMDEFGPIMSVAIISGIALSFVAYYSAIWRAAQHRMTGQPIYDFFMGAELNPRVLEWLDFKMFFEVRIPWFILFFVTLGACARQYEQYGYVSGELAFLLMAHWLYANACCKGEELITTTWDMYYEKLGFMLIFWNLAGVPLSYLHCTVYLANHDPATYRWPRPFLAFIFVSYLFAYWIWDTAGSQKNRFRALQRGTVPQRRTFPQLPYRKIDNPETIPVPGHDPLLCDGWYKYARKIHYTCDVWFAFCWALVTGFSSPFPWFYPVFFCIMIAHRAQRDIRRCRERYGDAWKEYERRVPYLFIPYVF